MKEQNLDFDKIINRTNTDSLKYDFAIERGKPEGILPLWVADMDFQTSSLVLDAVKERVEHGIFGYSEIGESYFQAAADWLEKRHAFRPKREWLVATPGIVFAIAMVVKAYTAVGDGIMIQQPVYYPFSEVIRDNGRRVISNDLVLGVDGSYYIDFEDFEQKIVENKIRLFLLCSPHNPVGRVWTEEELIKIGDICVKHKVIVVSDEIHADFVFGDRKHTVFASIKEDFQNISVTCTSPGKTFNLAGLQVSNIFIPNPGLRAGFKREVAASGYSQLNTLGIVACEAAYRYGGEWYDAMLRYVEGNLKFMKQYIEEKLPQLRMTETEGTYLAWVDFRGLLLSEKQLEELIVHKANLWLDSGAIFGDIAKGFERFNVATPRAILKQALDQLYHAIEAEGNEQS